MGIALDDQPLGADALGRVRWRCRRGLLENDLFIERFFARHGNTLTRRQVVGIEALMELSDPDLLDLLLARREPAGALDVAAVRQVLGQMRVAGARTSAATRFTFA